MQIRKSDWLDDWYVLRGAHTDIEGTSIEWREILEGMKSGKNIYHKRAASFKDSHGWWHLRSPRNAYGENDHALISPTEIVEFIRFSEAEIVAGENESADSSHI